MPQQSDELRLLRHIADLRFEEELRGYSKSQVDRVLQKLAPLADEFENLHQKLADAETRVASAEARLLERTGTESDVIAPPSAPVVEQAPSEPAVSSDPAVPGQAVAPQATEVPDTGSGVPATPADFDETLRKTLVLAQRTADETVKEAYDEADRITNNAHSEADLVLGKAKNEAEELETKSEQRRLELQAELDGEREERLATINTETETRRVELETALVNAEGSERAELLEQIADLQQVRTMLSSDIENLEGHLAARREIIQTALDEVANVLDDPERLRSGTTPEVSAVAAVTAGDYTDVGIDVDAELARAEGVSSGSARRSVEQAETVQDAGAESASASDNEGEVEELPELPQRRKAATLGEAEGTPVGSDSEPVDVQPEEAEDDNMVSISEALPPSLDDTSGPAPDAAGPPTEEFSFADVESDLAADTSDLAADTSDLAADTVNEPAPPAPVASETPPAPAPLTYEESSSQEESSDPWVDEASTADGGSDSDNGLPEDDGGRPAWMDSVPDDVADGPPPPPPTGGGQDPFLDQLRKATNEENPDSDEALDRFLDGDEEDGEKRPWFGRRR